MSKFLSRLRWWTSDERGGAPVPESGASGGEAVGRDPNDASVPQTPGTPTAEAGRLDAVVLTPSLERDFVYPVYLDIPMMASFYAAAGLAKELEKLQSSREEKAEHPKAEAGFQASFLEPVFRLASIKLNLGGSLEREKRSEQSVEIRSLFQHTEASLFNQLRTALFRSEAIYGVTPKSSRPLAEGDLLEIAGKFIGNPLEQLLEAHDRMLAYAGVRGEPPRKTRSELPWLWGLIGGASAVIEGLVESERNRPKVARILRDDLSRSYVRDLVMETDGHPRMTAVVVVSTEFFSGRSADYLLDGKFTVLGKVIGLTNATRPIDFMRRTALATMSAKKADKLVGRLRKDVKALGGSEALWMQPGEAAGRSPGMQILPLAIFV